MKKITSHTNEYIKELKSLKQKKYRDELGKYMIEGGKTVLEAIGCGEPVECVVVSGGKGDVAKRAKEAGIEVISVPYEIIEQISDTKSPPKEVACLKKKPLQKEIGGRFYVALDDVNDPKNLGTIIRTADAAGADGALISDNSADFYGPKAQRAAMGSTFHINVEVCSLSKRLAEFKKQGGRLVLGSAHGGSVLNSEYDKVCVVIGNESRGISQEILDLADEIYTIPIYGRAESLNASVAAGILLYDIRKRLKG